MNKKIKNILIGQLSVDPCKEINLSEKKPNKNLINIFNKLDNLDTNFSDDKFKDIISLIANLDNELDTENTLGLLLLKLEKYFLIQSDLGVKFGDLLVKFNYIKKILIKYELDAYANLDKILFFKKNLKAIGGIMEYYNNDFLNNYNCEEINENMLDIKHYCHVLMYILDNFFDHINNIAILEIGCYVGIFQYILNEIGFKNITGLDKDGSVIFGKKAGLNINKIDFTKKNEILSLKKCDFIFFINVAHKLDGNFYNEEYISTLFSNCLHILNEDGEIFFNYEKDFFEFENILKEVIKKLNLESNYLYKDNSNTNHFCLLKRKKINKKEIQMKHISLNVPTSYYCNQKCIFCVDKEKHLFSYLDTASALDETLTFLKNNSKIYDKVMFTFGEPTLNPNLSSYIKKAKDLGYKEIGIVTNGSRIAEDKLRKELAESGLDVIIFSIHGSNSTIHDFLTQVPGSFDKALKGLLFCKKEYKNLDIKVSYVLNKHNLTDLLSVIKLFAKIGISNIIINTIRPNLNPNDSNYYDNVYDFSDFLSYINSLPETDIKFLNSLIKNKKLNFTDIPICVLQKTKLDLFSYGKVEIRVVKQTDSNTNFHDTQNEKIYLEMCDSFKFRKDCELFYT
ncbi:MAG: radical SAM protein [Candidatus Gracilibacteria bacterium]|nr:radical SAM protein [Candidatus Gracilibacteria bacterium]